MGNPKVKKREKLDEDDSNRFAIMFTLIKAEKPITLSEIAKEINLPANLVFYHLQNLKEHYLVLETGDKKYTCQPVFKDDTSEDLDMLILLMIKTIARELEIDTYDEKVLSEAVIENLMAYIKIFEIEVE
jgi:predicted ArsR family transcriptional regulator